MNSAKYKDRLKRAQHRVSAVLRIITNDHVKNQIIKHYLAYITIMLMYWNLFFKVAAGMNTVLDVEIFAVAVGVVGESGLGHVGHHVEIVTETDILYLPVTANIL